MKEEHAEFRFGSARGDAAEDSAQCEYRAVEANGVAVFREGSKEKMSPALLRAFGAVR